MYKSTSLKSDNCKINFSFICKSLNRKKNANVQNCARFREVWDGELVNLLNKRKTTILCPDLPVCIYYL